MMKYENKRFAVIDSEINTGIQLYDKWMDKVVVDLGVGNKELNELCMIAITEIMQGNAVITMECFKQGRNEYEG